MIHPCCRMLCRCGKMKKISVCASSRLSKISWEARGGSEWDYVSLSVGRQGYSFFFFFNFTILYWFCHISTWIRHRYTRVPHPGPSSLLPSCTIPLGCPSAPAPSIQYRVSNLDWRLVSYMILYTFQCHSSKSSHPLPLPQSPITLYMRQQKRHWCIEQSFGIFLFSWICIEKFWKDSQEVNNLLKTYWFSIG